MVDYEERFREMKGEVVYELLLYCERRQSFQTAMRSSRAHIGFYIRVFNIERTDCEKYWGLFLELLKNTRKNNDGSPHRGDIKRMFKYIDPEYGKWFCGY